MLRCTILRARALLAPTAPLLSKKMANEKAAPEAADQEDSKEQETFADGEISIDSLQAGGDATDQHVLPQEVLKELLNGISFGQRVFLFGSANANTTSKEQLQATGEFFESVNATYEGRMERERQEEVSGYVSTRKTHYGKRLNEETEEFRRERKEIHDEIHRLEAEKYKNELIADVAEFTVAREKEYEVRLASDVEKYYRALQAYRARLKKGGKSSTMEIEDLAKNLSMDVTEAIEEMEAETIIRNFGTASGSEEDITDKDIRSYVVQRVCFYEKCVQDEVNYFTERRKKFYEDLLHARAQRHAAKVRADTEHFRTERQSYYDQRLTLDATWMSNCFRKHYDRCFLQSYARYAWIGHRRYQATVEGIEIGTGKGEKVPAISDPSKISISTLEDQLPLKDILDMYEKENMAEISRDLFLKAARRVATESRPAPRK